MTTDNIQQTEFQNYRQTDFSWNSLKLIYMVYLGQGPFSESRKNIGIIGLLEK